MKDSTQPACSEKDAATSENPMLSLPPQVTTRCISDNSNASNEFPCRRRQIKHYFLPIHHETRNATLKECTCPRCSGLLSVLRCSSGENSSQDSSFPGNSSHDMEGCYFDEPVPYIRGISEEEAYERQRNGTKACKKTGGTSTRSKYVSRIAKKEAESASKTKKNSIRNAKEREQRRQRKYEVKEGKLAAEMERAPAANKTLKRGIAARKERPRVVGGAAVLSAQELGIESEAMYDRLLQIMDGEDIRPEDFDLLLQLDKKNVISTMDEAKVSQFEILVIGVEDGEQRKSCTAAKGRDDGNSDGIRNVISRESLDDGFCLICLERFREMADGTELRRLPCEHVYCRPCIDQWLQNNSIKCPELSCFWNKEDEERSKQQQPREHNLVDTQQEERNEDTTDPNTNSEQ
mmetsp:Transcript_16257/g.23819  ORF Transcript_16257/g.23819 Transcript_16257/m.23819 type:complete len:406 (+) Transcript_16257:79-1296(+)